MADEAFGWLWKAKSPIKFKMFGWLLLVDRLDTRNMLRRRHFAVAGDNYACMFCQNPPEETIKHLFFKGPFSQRCWSKVGMSWPGGPTDYLRCMGVKMVGNNPSSWIFFCLLLGVCGWRETTNTSGGFHTPPRHGWLDSNTS